MVVKTDYYFNDIIKHRNYRTSGKVAKWGWWLDWRDWVDEGQSSSLQDKLDRERSKLILASLIKFRKWLAVWIPAASKTFNNHINL